MQKNNLLALLFLSSVLFAVSMLHAADTQPAPSLTAKEKQAVISEVIQQLNQYYVYPESAQKMADILQKRLQGHAYDSISNPDTFASTVLADIRAVNNDKHLGFYYAPENAAEATHRQSQDESESAKARERFLASARADNFGFRKVERMAGNVGYLDFRRFAPASVAGETAVAALNFLANCDAVIIDLRQNGGGDPTQIQLISTYFFRDPTHLNDIYTRSEDRTENFWTLPYVPGKKLVDADLYVLTSKYTFSGAEEFTYNMKNLKRATIIGETTGGGAHPTDEKVIQSKYILAVPSARAINPITKTNWEGTGVTPDITVPADQAFDKAYSMALEKLASKLKEPQRKAEALWVLDALKVKQNPLRLSEAAKKLYPGVYGERKVTIENGELFYQRTGPKYHLIPLNETTFMLEGMDDFRLQFMLREGKAAEVVGISIDGMRDPSPRTE